MTQAISGFFAVLSVLVGVALWLTHVVFCIKTASWGFLIAGAIFFPIGMVHGFMIWIGAV
jgi:hypothetical protein